MAVFSDEDYLAADDVEFRARFRERTHHTLEIQVYAAAYRNKTLSPTQADTAKHLSELWVRRGLPTDAHDYLLAQKFIEFADILSQGGKVDLSAYAPRPVSPEWEEAFFTIVRDRRSVREFTGERTPDELINKILDAGLWAAHSCNLQSIRYLVIREETSPGLFLGSDIPGGPVHLVVLQDERVYRANPYMPVRNHLLDAGAAAQNIVLAAHAAGLEGVWLTFNDAIIKRLKDKFSLPDYITPVTYVDVGYGDQTPYPVLRPPVEEMILGRA
ncbi:MAG: nitroreductase family protein [Spirochaetaceae bacterium]|jgi:nitroreductase|nr:nitroreductase family protein [Spirochaetaceae bacterium]